MIGTVVLAASFFPALFIFMWAGIEESEWISRAGTLKEARDCATFLLVRIAYVFSVMGFGIHLGAMFALPYLDLENSLCIIAQSYVALALLLWVRKRTHAC